jgi:hypothetical protein
MGRTAGALSGPEWLKLFPAGLPSCHPAAFTPRHYMMRASRVAFASRSSRSPWHGSGVQKHEIAPAELVERAQEVVLVGEPALVFRDVLKSHRTNPVAKRLIQ